MPVILLTDLELSSVIKNGNIRIISLVQLLQTKSVFFSFYQCSRHIETRSQMGPVFFSVLISIPKPYFWRKTDKNRSVFRPFFYQLFQDILTDCH